MKHFPDFVIEVPNIEKHVISIMAVVRESKVQNSLVNEC